MARDLKLAVAALNVRLHPHSPEVYRDFLVALYELRQPIKLRGERMGMITRLDASDFSGGEITGIITTFTRIDATGRWFDEEALDDAAPETVRQIRLLPKVHPNSAAFRFSFDISEHVFTFENYSRGRYLVPRAALALMLGLASSESIRRRFGMAAISIIQEEASVDRIFELRRLKEITFKIGRPNPDIWDEGLENQLDAHFAGTGAAEMIVKYLAPPGSSLHDTAELRRLAAATLRNGQIDASGVGRSGHERISTADFPMIRQIQYDPEEEGDQVAFQRLAGSMQRRRR